MSATSALGIRAGEGPRTARLFGFVFLVTAAAVLARSAQRELFLAAYPREAISDAFLWSAAALMMTSLGLSALAGRFSVVRLAQGLLVFSALAFAGARVAVGVAPRASAMGVYLVVEVLVSLLLTQGWAVVTEAVDVRSAKRLLPLVGVGAGLAWLLGGLTVGALARQLGPALILAVSPGPVLLALWVLGRIRRLDVAGEPLVDRNVGLRRGLRRIMHEPLLRVVALIVAVETMVEKVTDLQLLAMAQAQLASEAGAISAFMGLFYAATGAITLVTPVVSGRVLSRFGSTRALLAGQLYVVAASLLLLAVPQLAVVVLLSGGDRVWKQAIGSSARAQVLGAFPSAQRLQAGAVLRGVVASGASALAALGLKMVPADVPVHHLAWASVALMGGLGFVTWRWLQESYVLALRRSLDQSRLDLDATVETVALDREQLATYADELSSPDATRVSLAVSLLAGAPAEQTRALLTRALGHSSTEVRAQAVAVLGRRGDASDVAAIRAALAASDDEALRCACLEALAALQATDALPAMEALTTTTSPRVRALARACRMRLLEVRGEAFGADWVAFEAMMASPTPEEREAAAWAVGRVPVAGPHVQTSFMPLLVDAHPSVRRAAVASAGKFDHESIVRALVFALEEPATASAAFDAFSQLGEVGMKRVEGILRDAPAAVVSRTASALSRGRGESATDVLHGLLEHPDAQVRYRASRALVLRRRTSAWRPPDDDLVLRAIEAELAQGYRYHAALTGLRRELNEGDAGHRFVASEVDARVQETERRLLALVAVVADPRIARLSHHLRDASAQVKARLLELVDASLEPHVASLVVPFLERHGVHDEVPSAPEPGTDALGALMALGDTHLERVAMLAFQARVAERFPHVKNQEEQVLRLVERLRFLRSVPIFKNLSPEDLMKLAEIAAPASYPAGKTIFKKGDVGDVLCVVVHGKVEIRNQGQVVATQGPNDFFGELALFDQEPRSADAVCGEDTEVLQIGGADLDALMERRPEIAREIIRVLAKRLRTTTQELVGRPAK